MRTIVFPPGTHRTTRQVITAIAWATNRRGRNAWKSPNVTRSIAQYLYEQGVDVNVAQVSNALTWLVKHEYVERKYDANRTRTLEMSFHSEVDISGFMPVFAHRRQELPRITAEATAPAPPQREPHVSAKINAPTSTTTLTALQQVPQNGSVEPPLPFAEEDARQNLYRWTDLHDLAASWWMRDPEGWSNWVDRVIERLERAEEQKER